MQNSLIQVSHGTLAECKTKFKRCQEYGKKLRKELESRIVTRKRWFFFTKKISLWEEASQCRYTMAHYALFQAGTITRDEAQCIRMTYRDVPDYCDYTKYGGQIFLSGDEYDNMKHILGIKIPEEG